MNFTRRVGIPESRADSSLAPAASVMTPKRRARQGHLPQDDQNYRRHKRRRYAPDRDVGDTFNCVAEYTASLTPLHGTPRHGAISIIPNVTMNDGKVMPQISSAVYGPADAPHEQRQGYCRQQG